MYQYRFNPGGYIDSFNQEIFYNSGPKPFRQEILYGGIANGEMRMTYREYVEDFARPAFQQEARYQFDPNTPVTFKGAVVRILDASNQQLFYVVERGFSNEQAASVE